MLGLVSGRDDSVRLTFELFIDDMSGVRGFRRMKPADLARIFAGAEIDLFWFMFALRERMLVFGRLPRIEDRLE